MEIRISKFLRGGVLFSGVLIAIGWAMSFKSSSAHFNQFKEYDQVALQNFLLYHYNQGNWGQLISYSGLTLLILLPLIRVFLTGLIFVRQKEHVLALVAGFVLLFLIISFSLGINL